MSSSSITISRIRRQKSKCLMSSCHRYRKMAQRNPAGNRRSTYQQHYDLPFPLRRPDRKSVAAFRDWPTILLLLREGCGMKPFRAVRHSLTRPHWDREQTRSSVRLAFRKALQCRTPALGAEVYASENQERVVFHTCKSRACPSCGHRATIQWQRERWAAL